MTGEGGFEALELPPLLDLEASPRAQRTTLAELALHSVRAHGGDCREGFSQLKSAALEYRDTKIRAKYIKELDDLLK